MTLTQIFKSITKKEWQLVIFFSLAMIAITTAPLLYGWLITPPGQVFTGIHFSAPNDWFVYYSYLEQARQGNLLFKNLFTAEYQQPVFNVFWLGAGLFAKIFNLGNVLAFNLVRIFLIPVFYFAAYLFLAYLFAGVRERKIALGLLSFSSGLGFFLINRLVSYPGNFVAGRFNWPMDLWVPESNTFLTLYYSPHFIASLVLILAIFLLTILALENGKISYSLGAGLAAMALFSFHPFHVLTVLGVISAYSVFIMIKAKRLLWPPIRHYLVLIIFSLLPVGYYFYLLKTDWVILQKAWQNQCFTTPLWLTIFSFGLVLVLAVLGIYFLFKEKNFYRAEPQKFIFIIIWVAAQFLLLYFPVNYQRRMTEGLHFPLVALAVVGLLALLTLISNNQNRLTKFICGQSYLFLFFLTLLLVGSNLFQLSADAVIYQQNRGLAYLPQESIAAANWLRSISEDKIIFNSADNVVNFLPAYSGRTVYAGHGVETIYFRMKQAEVNWFFQKNRPPDWERNFLLKRNIGYIFYSEREKSLGSYDPAGKPYLKEVYANSKVKIYQVL